MWDITECTWKQWPGPQVHACQWKCSCTHIHSHTHARVHTHTRTSNHARSHMLTYKYAHSIHSCTHMHISRVPDQNGTSQAWYIVEMHHSGREPSIWYTYILSYMYALACRARPKSKQVDRQGKTGKWTGREVDSERERERGRKTVKAGLTPTLCNGHPKVR